MKRLLRNRWFIAMVVVVTISAAAGWLFYGKMVQLSQQLTHLSQEQATGQKQEVGRVTGHKGRVIAQLGNAKRFLTVGDAVFQGDRITTGRHSRLVLKMQDDAIIAIGEHTEFIVHQYVFKPQELAGQGLLELSRGFFQATSGGLAKLRERPFQVVTPVATMGVRGTKFWGRVFLDNEDGKSVPRLQTICLQPTCTIENKAGYQEIKAPNQTLTVRSQEEAPGNPHQATVKELTQAKLSVVVPMKLEKAQREKLRKRVVERLLNKGTAKNRKEAEALADQVMDDVAIEVEWQVTEELLRQQLENEEAGELSDEQLERLLQQQLDEGQLNKLFDQVADDVAEQLRDSTRQELEWQPEWEGPEGVEAATGEGTEGPTSGEGVAGTEEAAAAAEQGAEPGTTGTTQEAEAGGLATGAGTGGVGSEQEQDVTEEVTEEAGQPEGAGETTEEAAPEEQSAAETMETEVGTVPSEPTTPSYESATGETTQDTGAAGIYYPSGSSSGSRSTVLTLSQNTVAENSATGTVVGVFSSPAAANRGGATFVLEDDAQGRFTISGSQLRVADGTLLDYESDLSHQIVVTMTFNDQSDSVTQTFTIQVLNVNEPPVHLAPVAAQVDEDQALAFTSGGPLAVSVSDPDAGDYPVKTTIEVADGAIGVAGNSGATLLGYGTNQVILEGRAQDISQALTGLTLTPPAEFNGDLLLTITTNDRGYTGSGGEQVTSTVIPVTVVAINDPPVHTVPGEQAIDEDQPLTFSNANGNSLTVADVDLESGNLVTTLTVANGTLTAGAASGAAITGNGSASVAITGTEAQVNQELEGLLYTPTAHYYGAETLTIVSDDQGNTGTDGAKTTTDTVAITLASINDAPVHTLPGTVQSFDEDGFMVFSTANGNPIAVNDPDAGTDPIQTTLSVTKGQLQVAAGSNATITGDGTGTVVLTGDQAEINVALEGLTFVVPANWNGLDTLTISSRDQGYIGAGGEQFTTDTLDIVVNPVNDAPVNTIPPLQRAHLNWYLTFDSPDLTISTYDVDSDPNEIKVTLEITTGDARIKIMNNPNGATILPGLDTEATVVTIQGTQAQVNAALEGIFFQPVTNFFGLVEITMTTDDLGNTGGAALTDVDIIQVDVIEWSCTDIPTRADDGVCDGSANDPRVCDMSAPTVAEMLANSRGMSYERIFRELYNGNTVVVTEEDMENMIIGKADQQLTKYNTTLDSNLKSITDIITRFDFQVSGTVGIMLAEVKAIDLMYSRIPQSVRDRADALFLTLPPYASDYTACVRFVVYPDLTSNPGSVSFDTANSTVEVLHEATWTPNLEFNLESMRQEYNGLRSTLWSDANDPTGGLLRFFIGGPHLTMHELRTILNGDQRAAGALHQAIHQAYPVTPDSTSKEIPSSQRIDYFFPLVLDSVTLGNGTITLTPTPGPRP